MTSDQRVRTCHCGRVGTCSMCCCIGEELEAENVRLRKALEKVRRQADTHPGWIRDTVDEALNKEMN